MIDLLCCVAIFLLGYTLGSYKNAETFRILLERLFMLEDEAYFSKDHPEYALSKLDDEEEEKDDTE